MPRASSEESTFEFVVMLIAAIIVVGSLIAGINALGEYLTGDSGMSHSEYRQWKERQEFEEGEEAREQIQKEVLRHYDH